jgi:hypothetical protein
MNIFPNDDVSSTFLTKEEENFDSITYTYEDFYDIDSLGHNIELQSLYIELLTDVKDSIKEYGINNYFRKLLSSSSHTYSFENVTDTCNEISNVLNQSTQIFIISCETFFEQTREINKKLDTMIKKFKNDIDAFNKKVSKFNFESVDLDTIRIEFPTKTDFVRYINTILKLGKEISKLSDEYEKIRLNRNTITKSKDDIQQILDKLNIKAKTLLVDVEKNKFTSLGLKSGTLQELKYTHTDLSKIMRQITDSADICYFNLHRDEIAANWKEVMWIGLLQILIKFFRIENKLIRTFNNIYITMYKKYKSVINKVMKA